MNYLYDNIRDFTACDKKSKEETQEYIKENGVALNNILGGLSAIGSIAAHVTYAEYYTDDIARKDLSKLGDFLQTIPVIALAISDNINDALSKLKDK